MHSLCVHEWVVSGPANCATRRTRFGGILKSRTSVSPCRSHSKACIACYAQLLSVSYSRNEGFENFIAKIHAIIEEAGLGAFYVFDCLSRLAVDGLEKIKDPMAIPVMIFTFKSL